MSGDGPLTIALIEPDHIAYVTNDIERARKLFADRFGVGPFDTIEPALEMRSPEAPAKVHLVASFAAYGSRRLELIGPSPHDRSIFGAPLVGSQDFAIHFHHLGSRVSDVRPLAEAAHAAGLHVVSATISGVKPGGEALFVDLTATLGHWVEAVRLDTFR